MLWPNGIDYTQAIGFFPDTSILDPMLKSGNLQRGSNNYLIFYSGEFAIVFPTEVASDTFALRCWTKDIGDAETRYREISNYLKQCGLPYFVDFAYVPEGILVNDIKYPITRMEWAEGETLRAFIKQNFQDAECLKTAAAEFQKMVEALHAHQISHGHLQDGNILLKRDGADVEIKLIDYDSLFVPALRGQPDNVVGLPEYQHPQRITGGGDASEKADYFSELVIYLSLLGLAEKPDLWSQFGDRTERGLLFTAEDFKNPDQSDVFQELENLSPDVKQLAVKLKEFCKLSVDELEPLEAVLPKTSPAQVAHDQGFAYLHSNRHNEAIVEFEKAIALNSNYKEAYHGLGLAHFQMNNFGEAKRAAEAALRVDPHYQPTIQLLDDIKLSTPPSASPSPPPVGASGQTSTNPTSQSSPPTGHSGSTSTNPGAQRASLNRWRLIAGILACALVIWIVILTTQRDKKDGVSRENQGLRDQLGKLQMQVISLSREKQELGMEIVSLTRENQKLQDDNHDLRHKNTRNTLQNQERQSPPTGGRNEKISENQIPIIRKQASETDLAAQNRELQNQFDDERTKEDKEIQAQITKAQDEMVALRSENERLQDENEKLRSETRMLHDDNRALRNDNQRLDNENATLQKRLEELTQDTVESIPIPSYDHLRAAPLQEISLERRPRVRPAALSKNNQGYIAFNRSQYDKAIELFQDAIKSDSKSAIAHYNLGCTYLMMAEYTKARNYLRKAVTLDPNFKEAHYNLALVYLGWGFFPEAERAAQAALNIDENYPLARQLLETIE